MSQDYKTILLQILDIIHYINNKEKFVQEFEDLNKEEALINLLEKLPQEIQEKIKSESPGRIQEYINAQEYASELAKVSEEALAKFIEEILPSLSQQQVEDIGDLFPNIDGTAA